MSSQDQESDRDLAPRLLVVVLGVLCLRFSRSLWRVAAATETVVGAVPTAVVCAVAVQLIILGVAGFDFENHGRTIAYGVVGALTGASLIAGFVSTEAWVPGINTDSAAFLYYAIDLLQSGTNPMAVTMEPALDRLQSSFFTERVDGSRVHSWSYPAGMLLAYLPQAALVGETGVGYRLTTLVALGGVGMTAVWSLPRRLAVTAPLVMLLVYNMFRSAAGGVTDAVWLLPLLIGMILWARGQWTAAGLALGVSCGIKQLPWAVLPFLLIWTLRTTDGWRAFARRAGRLNAAGFVGFALFTANIAFIAWRPTAWWSSVMTPLGAGGPMLIPQGQGLAALALVNGVRIQPATWTLLVALVGTGALIGYWHFFRVRAVRWAAWVLPLAFWVVHSRSLTSYFSSGAVIAVVACAAGAGVIRGQCGQEVSRSCAE